MCKNYSIRHFLGAGLVFVGCNIHQLEAMKPLTTNEVLPHDFFYVPSKIPNMTNGARFSANQLSLTTDEIFSSRFNSISSQHSAKDSVCAKITQ